MNMIKTKKQLIILCVALAIMPLSTHAFVSDLFNEEFFDNFGNIEEPASAGTNSRVINEINVSANTGNNAAGGEAGSSGDKPSDNIKEGEVKTSIKVKSTINGKEMEPIDIESHSGKIEVKSQAEADGERVRVQREIEIDSEKKIENYEVDLSKPKAEAVKVENAPKQGKEESANSKKTFEGSLSFLRSRWSGLMESLKNFFHSIFNLI